ncbi:MAG: hypothetical protein L0Y56_19910, partial [Nitrospira sp.]|nr:hypothetical protein [Nitrospira sp.]
TAYCPLSTAHCPPHADNRKDWPWDLRPYLPQSWVEEENQRRVEGHPKPGFGRSRAFRQAQGAAWFGVPGEMGIGLGVDRSSA